MDEKGMRKWTDKELEGMEKKLTSIYKEAFSDIEKGWNAYMEETGKKIAPLEKAYEEAKASGDKEAMRRLGVDLAKEKKLQTIGSERYLTMADETAARMCDVNAVAVAYTNNEMPKIYTFNYNETLKSIETDLGKIDIKQSFTLVDERTVRRLVKTDTSLFPQKTINKAKDMKWNLKAINSQVLQGILQGESIPKISERLYNVSDMNAQAAIRNARTMTTAAENNGRLEGIYEAEEKGIVYEKQWMATHDDRTRESHAELDGVSVPTDEEFPNGLYYPGDPAGDPEEVYNCFVGKTKVGANSRIIRTYKHKYDGDLFTIKTASGIQFTCTPNHPILTSRGWIAANRINDGDDLFVTSVSKKPFFVTWSNPNINHVLARFDTLHKFFYVLGSKRTTDLGVNFHGDIPTSDVEIITQKRLLRKSRNSCRRKSINKFFFILADKAAFCKSTFVKHFSRIWQSSFCDIGGKSKSFSLFGRCLRHSKIHSLRPIALLDSGRIQKSYNNGARYAQLLGNSLNGFSGIVFADKVISIDIKFSHCDVFNLQSENGYYFASSIIPQRHRKGNNDIMVIAHNCRCSLVRNLVGFRKPDGRIEKPDIKDRYKPDYFDTQKQPEGMEQAKTKIEPEEKTEEQGQNDELFETTVDDLSEDMRQMIYDYTDGDYRDICDYTQYLVNGDEGVSPSASATSTAAWKKDFLPYISQEKRQQAEQLYNTIVNQPILEQPLVRLERSQQETIGAIKEGDTLSFGVRSASQDQNFINRLIRQEDEGFEYELLGKNNSGNWIEYRFETAKGLDISSISAYPDQKETMIAGNYEVVKMETVEPIKPERVYEYIKVADIAENVRYFTSKSGKDMVEFTFEDRYGDKKTQVKTVDQFKQQTETHERMKPGQFGRTIITVRAKDE